MGGKDIIRKVFINKKNNQLTIPLSRKQLKAINPKLKLNKDLLFAKIKIFNLKGSKDKWQ